MPDLTNIALLVLPQMSCALVGVLVFVHRVLLPEMFFSLFPSNLVVNYYLSFGTQLNALILREVPLTGLEAPWLP